MVSKSFLVRLVLDFIAFVLLFVAMAYYWLENTAHEWIGISIFVLTGMHNIFNRRWWGAFVKQPSHRRPASVREPRNLFDRALTLSLLAIMLVLVLSSLMISQSAFSFLHFEGGFTARQIHILAAYWAVIFVSIHLGLRWQRVMATVRNLLQLKKNNAARTVALRVLASAMATYGLASSFVLGVGSKLFFQMSLEWWDFEASVAGFFLHWFSIAGLYVFLTYYTLRWLQTRQRKACGPPPLVKR